MRHFQEYQNMYKQFSKAYKGYLDQVFLTRTRVHFRAFTISKNCLVRCYYSIFVC
mgnify:CR=1 FL=1